MEFNLEKQKDLYQSIMENLYISMEKSNLSEIKCFKSWVKRIIANTINKHVRNSITDKDRLTLDNEKEESECYIDKNDAREKLRIVNDFIKLNFREKDRTIIQMQMVQEPADIIADVVGMTTYL